MLGYTMMQWIDHKRRDIAGMAVRRIRQDGNLVRLAKKPESELRDWAEGAIEKLRSWPGDGELNSQYEEQGRRWLAAAVPLHEIVRGFQLLRYCIGEFVHNEQIRATAVDILAEEELQESLCLMFDRLIYHSVHGYERALRNNAVRVDAAGSGRQVSSPAA